MRSLQGRRIITLGAVFMALAIFAVPAWAASLDQDANLLTNPSFEGGTYDQVADGVTHVPNGWVAWWSTAGGLYKPAYEIEQHPPHVRDGSSAARYYTAYTNHDAGLYQQVNVTAGTTYRFVAWGFIWSTNEPVVDTPSTADSNLRIGIDPKGGTDPFASSVIWSPAVSARDTYQKFTVEAKAEGNKITVFLRNTTLWPMARNDAFWDDTALRAVSGSGTGAQPTNPPPQSVRATPDANGRIVHTVGVGDTLSYIAWLYGVPMDQIRRLNNLQGDIVVLGTKLVIQEGYTPTPAPTEEPTITPTLESTEVAEQPPAGGEAGQPAEAGGVGSICVMGYADLNANGIREADETRLAGVTFMINNGAEMVGTYTTDGVNEPYCFNNLPAGTYIVSWTGENLTATNDQTWSVELTAGSILTREFGIKPIGAEAAAPQAEARQGGLPTWAVALIGAAAVVIFLGGLGTIGYLLLLRRTQI